MEFESNSYSLIIPEYVQNQLRTIKNYIETMYFSEQAGINTVNNILHGLERLTNSLKPGLMQMKESEKSSIPHTKLAVSF